MSDYYKISLQAEPAVQEILIAILAESGYEGFEQSETELQAFIPAAGFSAELLDGLADTYSLSWSQTTIPKQNWNELWESNFEPVQVDDFAGIRAYFHPPFSGVEHDLVITPKMSFGTGHHATTYMVMQLMRELDFSGKAVFDFGTGTGILAILAEKMGAERVVAVDNDDWCIENTLENLAVNKCARITVEKIDILSFERKFDIIIANINRNIILENILILRKGLAPGGSILLSGLLQEDEKDIHAACQSVGFQHLTTIERYGWIALRYF